jgi:hypothetical protein
VIRGGFGYPSKIRDDIKEYWNIGQSNNAKLIHEFYLYWRAVNTSESYQNQNIKALINVGKIYWKKM